MPQPSGADSSLLSPLRTWRSAEVEGAVYISRLRHDPVTGLTFGVDAPASRVQIFDPVLGHAGERLCVTPESLRLDDPGDPAWQEDCGPGEVSLHRGYIDALAPVDVAIDPVGLSAWVVSEGGELYRVELDLMAGPTLGYLRADPPISTGLTGLRSAVWAEGSLWVAQWDRVLRLGPDGAVVEERPALEPELLSGDGGLWLHTSEGLVPPVGEVLPGSWAAAAGGRGITWSDGQLLTTDGWSMEWPSPPAALAIDPRGEGAWVLTATELIRVDEGGGEAARVTVEGGGGAIAPTWTHEVVVVGSTRVGLYADERPLADDRPPLYLTSLTALEKPAQYSDPIACSGEGAVGARLAEAERTWAWLQTQPGAGSWGVAVSARFAEAVESCGEQAAFEPWLDGHGELGLMLHQPTGCGDPSCYRGAVRERADQVLALGVRPTWATAFHGERFDWVSEVRAQGVDRYLLFGAGIDPALGGDDPRSKEGFPLLPGGGTAAFAVEEQAALPPPVPLLAALMAGCHPPPAELSFYPGTNRAAFAQDQCEGLLYVECIYLERNSGWFDEDDLVALALAIRRAAARRSDGVASFTWHLADLGEYPYTEGCEISGAALDGGCEATWIADILKDFDILSRAGVAAWAAPGELPAP